MLNRADGLKNALDDLMRSSPEIEAAAVVSADGLPMSSNLPPHFDEDRLSAMAAAMLSLGERASESLGRGRLHQVFVEGSSGYVLLMAAGQAVLAAVTRREAKVGLIIYEMRRVASTVARVLEYPSEEPSTLEAVSEIETSDGEMPVSWRGAEG